MPYQGYTGKEISKLLRRSTEMLRRSGVLHAITKQYPFGTEHLPLYAIKEVEQWEVALRRRDGLVALGRLQRTEPLINALEIPADHDTECPKCGGWAIGDPEAGEGNLRTWCPRCKVAKP